MKCYPESCIPENRPQFRQLIKVFETFPIIRDIDFSKWYKYVSLIVETSEYLGREFPEKSVFYVKFIKVYRFNFAYESEDENESSVSLYNKSWANLYNESTVDSFIDNDNEPALMPYSIEQFTKEKDKDNFFYRIITSSTTPRLEIDFDDVEIMFIGTIEMIERIERGKSFLTPQAKEKILYRYL
jgi:hypothetical protein